MPFLIAKKLDTIAFDVEKFTDWFRRLPDLDAEVISKHTLSNRAKLLMMWAYYFWALYIAAAAVVATLSPVVSIIAIVLSPFLVIGGVYVLINTFSFFNTKPKRTILKHKRTSKQGITKEK